MKVTILCKYYAQRGGAQTFLRSLVEGLLARSHCVKVVAMQVDDPTGLMEAHLLRVSKWPRALRDVRFARASLEALQGDDADVVFGEQRAWGADVVRPGMGVHAVHVRQVARSYPAGLLRPLRVLGHKTSLKEGLEERIERRLYGEFTPQCVIANSDTVRRDLTAAYPHLADRIVTIYNGADCERFHPGLRAEHRDAVRASLGIPLDALVGAFVSADPRRKGFETVARALAVLKAKDVRPQVHAICVGPDKGWMRTLLRRLGVVDRMHLIGRATPDAYYAAADVGMLPTWFDPCANVTFEALACGLPVLTSMANGAYEILTPGEHGFYVHNPDDVAQFAGFCEWYLDEPARLERSARAARELAERMSRRTQQGRVVDVLEEVAEQKRRA